MTIADASQYLPHMGLDPLRVVGCARLKCQNSFTLTNGFVIEAIVREKVSFVFFRSADCYLDEVRVNCCARQWWNSTKFAIDVAAASAWSPTAGGATSSADGHARTPIGAKSRSAEIGCFGRPWASFTKTDRLMSSKLQ
jgi:hypothetical protein